MVQESPDRTETGVSIDRAADVFRELGDPTRVAIIVALVEGERAGESPLTFEELRKAVDIPDSGRFNYHLQQLQPRFVQSVDGGYQSRYAGMMAYGLIQARTGTSEAFELEGPSDRSCLLCGEVPTARYASDRITLTCDTYGEQLLGMPVPPAVAEDRSLADIIDFALSYGQQQLSLALDGLCPYCWGSVEYEMDQPEVPAEQLEDDPAFEPPIQVHITCTRCKHSFNTPLRVIISDHPAVAGFFYRRGVDLSGYDLLERFDVVAVEEEAISDDDGAWIRFGSGDGTLRVEVDDTADVITVSGSIE